MTNQFRRLFRHISYFKKHQSNFITNYDRLLLQSALPIAKCDRLLSQSALAIKTYDRLLLQSASGIAKCDRLHYKVRQVLHCNNYYKMRRNSCYKICTKIIHCNRLNFVGIQTGCLQENK